MLKDIFEKDDIIPPFEQYKKNINYYEQYSQGTDLNNFYKLLCFIHIIENYESDILLYKIDKLREIILEIIIKHKDYFILNNPYVLIDDYFNLNKEIIQNVFICDNILIKKKEILKILKENEEILNIICEKAGGQKKIRIKIIRKY